MGTKKGRSGEGGRGRGLREARLLRGEGVVEQVDIANGVDMLLCWLGNLVGGCVIWVVESGRGSDCAMAGFIPLVSVV